MVSTIFFILIISSLINKILLNNGCKDIRPNNRNDCFSISVSDGYCCYNSEGKNCEFISKEKLKNNYKLDCGISEDNYEKYEFGEYHPKQDFPEIEFQTCGTYRPQKKEDCTDYSELTNSCCLFKANGKKGCFLIGRRFDSDLKEENSFAYNKTLTISYECNSLIITFSLYSILFLFLLL